MRQGGGSLERRVGENPWDEAGGRILERRVGENPWDEAGENPGGEAGEGSWRGG